MLDLIYSNIKSKQYIEIIYKSPSIFLDGIFLKSPPINMSQINILNKYSKYSNNYIINLLLDNTDHIDFINILKSIDEYLYNSILKNAKYINSELSNSTNNIKNNYFNKPQKNKNNNINYFKNNNREYNNTLYNNTINENIEHTSRWDNSSSNYDISLYKYENIIKQQNNCWEFNMKSYLDKKSLDNLYNNNNNNNKTYIFTFNITNIYLSNSNLLPLVKCNKYEI